MNSTEIRSISSPCDFIGQMLQEIAAQLSDLNETLKARNARGVKTKKTPIVSVARRSSNTKRFYVEHWKTAVDSNMLPEFKANEGFKALDDIAVGESTEGKLGTQDNAKIRRIQ